ncbi:MAG: radical SAM protein [Pirellulales bacterium]|nr:radical SAM protein [Pirellulales bacterium]
MVDAARLLRRVAAAVREDLAGLGAALATARARPSGLYTYKVHPGGGERHLHLRIGKDGSGVLLVDVTEAIHLNPTAARLAKAALDGVPLRRARNALGRDVPKQARPDARRRAEEVYRMVEHLATFDRGCPTCGLDELRRAPLFSCPVDAPYKADVALTYACNNACVHCYNPPSRRAMRPLPTDQWRRVVAKLAEVGIPHVVFTGGEPTLVAELPELIADARRRGLVVGMNTNGRRLAEPGFTPRLVDAGLNHVQITIDSCRPEVHNAMTGRVSFDETLRGIHRSLDAGLHTITNTTLTRANVDHVEEHVEFLQAQGLRTIAANGMIHAGRGRGSPEALTEEELAPVLIRLRDRAEALSLRLLWYTPTAYCRLSPLALELGPRRCNAAEYSICIEPNGDVLPCQSYYEPAGNLLAERWETIWNGPLFTRFRRRGEEPRAAGLPEPCWDCPELPVCGGGCPLEQQTRARPKAPAREARMEIE